MSHTRRSARAAACAAMAVIAGLFCAPGCRTHPKPTDVPKNVVTQRWVEPDVPPESYLELDKAMTDGLAVALGGRKPPMIPAESKRPLNLLAISAGGKFGAYTAGVLGGWQAHGDRPEFDVVTGVSSGAIIAVYAFCGPQHDGKVRHFFTETDSKQLFRFRPALYLIKYGSVATAEPLRKIIEQEISEDLIAEIRAGHEAGRRLYLATLNIQSKHPVIWDIGAIACSGRPDSSGLIRKIILAACSVPGMTPPVEFDVCVDGQHYKEKHSDGGAVTQTYIKLAREQATPQPGAKWLEGSNLYVLAAGKFYSDPADPQTRILGRIGASVSSSLYALYRAELCKLYAFCLVTGMSYNIIGLDPSIETDSKSMNINPEHMKKLYDAGFQQACKGVPWRKVPPGGLAGEDETPRQGSCFITLPLP